MGDSTIALRAAARLHIIAAAAESRVLGGGASAGSRLSVSWQGSLIAFSPLQGDSEAAVISQEGASYHQAAQ